MTLWQDSHFRTFFYLLFAIYTGAGLFGTLWVSDEFDAIRLTLVTYTTLPALCVFLVGFIEDLSYWNKWPRLFWGSIATVVVTLVWSMVLLLNAFGGSQPLVLSHSFSAMTINSEAKRGAFGLIYQTRW